VNTILTTQKGQIERYKYLFSFCILSMLDKKLAQNSLKRGVFLRSLVAIFQNSAKFGSLEVL